MPGVADERVEDPEVGAVGVRQRRERVVVGRLRRQAALHVGRQVEAEHVRRERDLGERHLRGRATPRRSRRRRGTRGRPRRPRACAATMRLHLVLQLGGRARDRAGDHDGVARAAGPGARQRVLRVGVGDDDRGRVDVELLGDDLRDDRLGAVAPQRLRVQRDDDLPGRVDLQARALGARRRRELRLVEPEPELRRAEDAALLRGDDADPDVAALGARAIALGDPVRRSRPPRAPSRATPW